MTDLWWQLIKGGAQSGATPRLHERATGTHFAGARGPRRHGSRHLPEEHSYFVGDESYSELGLPTAPRTPRGGGRHALSLETAMGRGPDTKEPDDSTEALRERAGLWWPKGPPAPHPDDCGCVLCMREWSPPKPGSEEPPKDIFNVGVRPSGN